MHGQSLYPNIGILIYISCKPTCRYFYTLHCQYPADIPALGQQIQTAVVVGEIESQLDVFLSADDFVLPTASVSAAETVPDHSDPTSPMWISINIVVVRNGSETNNPEFLFLYWSIVITELLPKMSTQLYIPPIGQFLTA